MRNFVSLFLIFFLLWILIGGIHIQELILGGVVALILAYLLSSYLKITLSMTTVPKILLFILLYIPLLTIELIKANFDVARRVLDPKLPLNPGFVRIPTSIKSDLGKLVLANSITLTPGTLSIDADESSVLIHWIDVKGSNSDVYQKEVSGSFEKLLRRIFND